jgi:hypothetical protein
MKTIRIEATMLTNLQHCINVEDHVSEEEVYEWARHGDLCGSAFTECGEGGWVWNEVFVTEFNPDAPVEPFFQKEEQEE